MFKRSLLFLLWAAIGSALSLGLLYAFTPFGLVGLILIGALIVQLDRIELNRAPEVWGLLAGPGLFCLLIAANVEMSAGWLTASVTLLAASVAGFAISGRALCARS